MARYNSESLGSLDAPRSRPPAPRAGRAGTLGPIMNTPQCRKRTLLKASLILFAISFLLWFPWAFSEIVLSGYRLLFGIGGGGSEHLFLRLGLGSILALAGLYFVCRQTHRGRFGLAAVVVAIVIAADFVAIPAARWAHRKAHESPGQELAPSTQDAENQR